MVWQPNTDSIFQMRMYQRFVHCTV